MIRSPVWFFVSLLFGLLLAVGQLRCHHKFNAVSRVPIQVSARLVNCTASSQSSLTVQDVLHWAAASWTNSSAMWQRPQLYGLERTLTSPVFERVAVRSLNPPAHTGSGQTQQPVVALELQSRLVIGIVLAVHSGFNTAKSPSEVAISELQIIKTTLSSLVPTLQPAYIYRLYLGFDGVDPVYSQAVIRGAVQARIKEAVAAEDAGRWHPVGYQPGTVSPSALLVSVHWVWCNYTGKPAWSQNDAALAAFKEGADYVLRTNDDTLLPARQDWVSAFVSDLRSRPVPNLGVVGPACPDGNIDILTHDFTHRTHAIIFGFYYPRSMPTLYGDAWMTSVYTGFTPNLMVKRQDVQVKHLVLPQRYDASQPPGIQETMKRELAAGKAVLQRFVTEQYRATLQDSA